MKLLYGFLAALAVAQDDVTDDVTAADYSAVEQEFARTSDDYEEGEDRGYGYQSYGGSYGGSYSNPGYGGYDYGGYGNSGYYGSKSQNSQSGGVGSTVKGNNLVMSTSNALPSASNAANGRAVSLNFKKIEKYIAKHYNILY